jgi:hypothetical protein
VRIAWECNNPLSIDDSGAPLLSRHVAQRSGLPPAPQCLPRGVEAGATGRRQRGGEKLKAAIKGKLDISATGCKLRFEGDIRTACNWARSTTAFAAPPRPHDHPVELRHLHFEERSTPPSPACASTTSAARQRKVERFVYQLQREARRFDKDDDFYCSAGLILPAIF